MTKQVCKISRLNSNRLLRKLQKMLGGYFILPHPVQAVVTVAAAAASAAAAIISYINVV